MTDIVSRMFNLSTKLKDLKLTVGNRTINNKLIQDLEIVYSIHNPQIIGSFQIQDLANLDIVENLTNADVTLYFKDLYNQTFRKKFKIQGLERNIKSNDKKLLKILVQDEYSFNIQNLTINTSKEGTIADLFSEIETNLNLPQTQKGSFSEQTFFQIQETDSIYNILIQTLYDQSAWWYQDTKGVYLKSWDEMLPSKQPAITGNFVENPPNEEYKFKIKDARVLKTGATSLTQRQLSILDTETGDTEDKGVVDINSLLMPRNNAKLPELKTIPFTKEGAGDIKREEREAYFETNVIEIVTSGYVETDINKLYTIKMSAHSTVKELVRIGQKNLNNQYLCVQKHFKISGTNCLQKLILQRIETV